MWSEPIQAKITKVTKILIKKFSQKNILKIAAINKTISICKILKNFMKVELI